MITERIDMRSPLTPLTWQKTEKQYFKEDPPKSCFVENNPEVAGAPLWPKDASFQSETIEKSLGLAKELIEAQGGHLFSSHIALSPDRTIKNENELFVEESLPLSSTFVSGFLLPLASIETSQMGFYLQKGKSPSMKEVVQDLKGTWLLSNLGYFLTPKLIQRKEEQGVVYSHNSRHPASEHLSPSDNSYLGGFFVRKGNQFIAFPPLLETAGVGITKQGKPLLIDKVQLRGGTVNLNGNPFHWTAQNVNPKEAGNSELVIYTPSFTTEETLKAQQTNNWKDYRQYVGENRINVVCINEGTGNHPHPRIAYIKEGTLLQPASGIVLSFAKELKPSLEVCWKNTKQSETVIPAKAGIQSCQQFLDPCLRRDDKEMDFPDRLLEFLDKEMTVSFEFEPWFDKNLWDNLDSFYEGLLPLSLHGEQKFGVWEHPHAILTQETYIPNPYRREPRTVLVKTANFFGAFAFSGRYEYSVGISFSEMSAVLKAIIKKINVGENLEQVISLDGGSGAKICLVKNGKPEALNWVAPGFRNRMGDPNGNTYSCLMLKIAD